MGPLWAEIMDHIDPVLSDEMETKDRSRPPAKLAIYSGYDSTIMEVLSSLGAWVGEEWPPYASMVLLEVCIMEGIYGVVADDRLLIRDSLRCSSFFKIRSMSSWTMHVTLRGLKLNSLFGYFTMVKC
jgi:hypothetical protein